MMSYPWVEFTGNATLPETWQETNVGAARPSHQLSVSATTSTGNYLLPRSLARTVPCAVLVAHRPREVQPRGMPMLV